MADFLEFATRLGLPPVAILAVGALVVLWRRYIQQQDLIAAERRATADVLHEIASAVRDSTQTVERHSNTLASMQTAIERYCQK